MRLQQSEIVLSTEYLSELVFLMHDFLFVFFEEQQWMDKKEYCSKNTPTLECTLYSQTVETLLKVWRTFKLDFVPPHIEIRE